MEQLAAFRSTLERIDAILDAYSPPALVPDRPMAEIFDYHSAHQGDLAEAVALATEALKSYPLHPALLLRRAAAQAMMRSGDLSAHAEAAQADLQLALFVDDSNYEASGRLLHLLFTFSIMEDADVAAAADQLAERVTRDLLATRALQIRALGYADRLPEARELYSRWSQMYPSSKVLKEAFDDAAELSDRQDD